LSGSASPTPRPDAREWWRPIELVHAVTYFAEESRRELAATGLRGFWMGYFAARVAPVGPVEPATVVATFFNFHPAMVERSLPDAWSFADPPDVLAARRQAAGQALRRLDPSVEVAAGTLVPLLERVVAEADGSGRVLFSANRALDPVDDPVESLWQACTCLREHRGDGHVAALTTAGLSGCQALVLFALSEGLPPQMFLDARGWSTEEWGRARVDLERRGLVHGDQMTPLGLELRRGVEQTTDGLAAQPFAVLGHAEAAEAHRALSVLAGRVAAGGEIPFPNPMGLPAPGPGEVGQSD
jgi:hypothetical protein